MQWRLTIVSAFAPLFLLASIASAARNPATGADVGAWSGYTPVPARPGATEVLWDTTHGVCFGYEPSGVYADLVAMLVGFNFTTTSAGLNNIDLSPYQILVICVGSACSSTYNLDEVSAIQGFAASGGRVLILGDNPGAWEYNINPVAQAFGASTGVVLLDDDLYFSNLSSHPIFNGIDEIYFRAGGSLSTAGAMQPQAWTNDGDDITVAVSENPCVVVIGDINVFGEPEFFNLADNRAFATNVFNWLGTCGGAVNVDESSWGSIKSWYRK